METTERRATGSSSSSESSSYQVQRILKKRTKNGKQEFLVVWKNYPENQATWQPHSNLTNCSKLLLEFELAQIPQQMRENIIAQVNAEKDFNDFTDPSPHPYYLHNLASVTSSKTPAQYCQERSRFINTLLPVYTHLPSNAVIKRIITAEVTPGSQRPSYYAFEIEGDRRTYTGTWEELMSSEQGRHRIIDFYEQCLLK